MTRYRVHFARLHPGLLSLSLGYVSTNFAIRTLELNVDDNPNKTSPGNVA
jgi:hypothetical protein